VCIIVVTIPTSLAVAESRRLVSSLQSEGIKVSAILCNQVNILINDMDEFYMCYVLHAYSLSRCFLKLQE